MSAPYRFSDTPEGGLVVSIYLRPTPGVKVRLDRDCARIGIAPWAPWLRRGYVVLAVALALALAGCGTTPSIPASQRKAPRGETPVATFNPAAVGSSASAACRDVISMARQQGQNPGNLAAGLTEDAQEASNAGDLRLSADLNKAQQDIGPLVTALEMHNKSQENAARNVLRSDGTKLGQDCQILAVSGVAKAFND